MSHHAIFVGGEGFDRGSDLPIGLLAFEFESDPIAKHIEHNAVVGARDADVIDSFDRSLRALRQVEGIAQKRTYASKLLGRKGRRLRPIQPCQWP